MISCERTSCPWWDEDGCLSEECGAWEDGTWMNKPEEAIARGPAQHGALPKYFTTYKGEKISVHALSVQTGVHYQLLRYRIDRMGMTGGEAVERTGQLGGRREGAGRKKKFSNGCRFHADCDSCPFDDCRM